MSEDINLSYESFKKIAEFVPELCDFVVSEGSFNAFLCRYRIQPFGSLIVGDIPLMFRISAAANKYLTYSSFVQLCSQIQLRVRKQKFRVQESRENGSKYDYKNINNNCCLNSKMPQLLRETFLPPSCPYPTSKPVILAIYAMIEKGEYKQALDSLCQLQNDWKLQEQDNQLKKSVEVESEAIILPLEQQAWILCMKTSILISQQKYQEANQFLKQLQNLLSCLRLHPFYGKVVILSGVLKFKMEEITKAMHEFEQAEKILQEKLELQFDVDDQIDLGVAQNNLAISALCLGFIGKSVAKFKQSMDVLKLGEGGILGTKYNVTKQNLKMSTTIGIGGSFSPVSTSTNFDNIKTLKQFLLSKTYHGKYDFQTTFSTSVHLKTNLDPKKKKKSQKKRKDKKNKKKSIAQKTTDGQFLPRFSQNHNFPPKYGVINSNSEEKKKQKKR